MSEMKILLIDIETSPHLSWHWGLYNQNIAPTQVVQRSRTLCFAAKFLGKRVQFFSEWDQGHDKMVWALFDLLDQADVVVAYNGDAFDIKTINAEFARYKLGRPAPYQTIDLYKVVKRNFRFFNSKFDSVLSELSLEGKVKHRGFSLWPAVMAGDVSAQKEMKRYCVGDVYPSLEQLYYELLPWITNHPNHSLYSGDAFSCPNCNSQDLRKEGHYYTGASKFQRYQCRQCGTWSYDPKRIQGSNLRGVR